MRGSNSSQEICHQKFKSGQYPPMPHTRLASDSGFASALRSTTWLIGLCHVLSPLMCRFTTSVIQSISSLMRLLTAVLALQRQINRAIS